MEVSASVSALSWIRSKAGIEACAPQVKLEERSINVESRKRGTKPPDNLRQMAVSRAYAQALCDKVEGEIEAARVVCTCYVLCDSPQHAVFNLCSLLCWQQYRKLHPPPYECGDYTFAEEWELKEHENR